VLDSAPQSFRPRRSDALGRWSTLPARNESWPPDFAAADINRLMPIGAAIGFLAGCGMIYGGRKLRADERRLDHVE